MGRIYGYARVSTTEQNIDRQIEALKKYKDDIILFQDKASGKDFKRPEYEVLKRVALDGDTIVVKEMDRLGRDKDAIKKELQYFKEKGVRVVILDIPTTTVDISGMDEGVSKEMLNMINNVLIEVLSTIAEQERKKIRERQAEGIAIAKQKGVKLGRPKTEYPKQWNDIYIKWKNKEITSVKAMKLLDLKKSTFYRLVHDFEL